MTVSWYGVRGGRSSPQSKYGFTTTDVIVCGAESMSLRLSGDPKRYPYTSSPQRIEPETALAYGSSSSFAEFVRSPRSGA